MAASTEIAARVRPLIRFPFLNRNRAGTTSVVQDYIT